MRRLLVTLLIFALPFPSGCSDISSSDESSIRLTNDRVEYFQGDTIGLELINQSDDLLSFNFCIDSRIVRGTERIAIAATCSAELQELAPGARSMYRIPVTTAWSPGEYRLALTFRFGNAAGRQIQTPLFLVRDR